MKKKNMKKLLGEKEMTTSDNIKESNDTKRTLEKFFSFWCLEDDRKKNQENEKKMINEG